MFISVHSAQLRREGAGASRRVVEVMRFRSVAFNDRIWTLDCHMESHIRILTLVSVSTLMCLFFLNNKRF